ERAGVVYRRASGTRRRSPAPARSSWRLAEASPHRPGKRPCTPPDNGALGHRVPDGTAGIRRGICRRAELQRRRRRTGTAAPIPAELVRRHWRHRGLESTRRVAASPRGDWTRDPAAASDVNPAAVELLRANIGTNRVDRVAAQEGDAHRILEKVAPVDRIILDLPHTAFDHLPDAFAAIGASGVVHVYRILERADERAAADRIRAIAAQADLEIRDLQLHTVRAYSPTQHHVAFDVTVVRASHRAAPGRSPSASRTSPTTGTPARGRRSARTARRLATRGRRSRHSGR